MDLDRRKVLKTGAALAALAGAGCASTAPGNAAALRARADALLSAGVKAGDVPGVVAAVTTPSRTIYEGAFGQRVQGQAPAMTPDTVFWIASMTKPVAAAAAMQLVEQGKLSLDGPAAAVLPDLDKIQVLDGFDAAGQPQLRAPRRPITLRHLLTHTTGFAYDLWDEQLARYVKVTNAPAIGTGRNAALYMPLMFDPGERWEYGINIDWAGKMVEAASGMKLGAYLDANFFKPLGMSSTAFRLTPEMRSRMVKVHARNPDGTFTVTPFELPQDPEFEPGGGGLYSTVQDYQHFVRLFLNGGRGNGHQLLKPATVDLMSHNAMGNLRVTMLRTYNPALSADAEFFPGLHKTWGLSFMINEQQAPTGRSPGSLAWAGLANTFFWIDPAKKIGGVYMSQVLPFVDPRTVGLFLGFEKAVYETAV